MSTKDIADKLLNTLYGGTVDKLRAERDRRSGADTYIRTSIVTPKPGGESHLEQIAREFQERQAENEKALEEAHARRQAAELSFFASNTLGEIDGSNQAAFEQKRAEYAGMF